MKKLNKYIFDIDCGIGYTRKGDNFYFDKEDFYKIKDFTWWIDAQGYVRTEIWKNNERIVIKMHNLITGEKLIDHNDRNKTNNRKYNLIKTTKQRNALNSKIQINNTSGVRGVSMIKNGSFESYLKNNGIKKYLGLFVIFEDAVRARLLGEIEYFGREFAPQKYLFAEYGV